MMKRYLILVSLLFIFLLGCSSEDENQSNQTTEESELEPVTFVLDWTPNTNHTGIYVAQEEGYFEEEGLDVEIILPGEVGANQLISTGKADLGISYQEGLIMARNEDLPLVSVAAIIQHNTAGYASPVEKGITEPADFEGKKFGGVGTELEQAMMETILEEDNVDIDTVDFINIGESDFFTAIKRDVDFSLVYQAWTGIEAEIRNEELNMIYLKDLSEGLDFYTPIVATSEQAIEDNPEMVEKFVKATVKGYEFAMEEPDEAANILIESVPDINEELVHESQKWLVDKYQAEADEFGIQETERWENVYEFMDENDLIKQDFDVDQAFTNEFLPKD